MGKFVGTAKACSSYSSVNRKVLAGWKAAVELSPEGATRGSGFSWEDEPSARMSTLSIRNKAPARGDFRGITRPWRLKIPLLTPTIVLIFPPLRCVTPTIRTSSTPLVYKQDCFRRLFGAKAHNTTGPALNSWPEILSQTRYPVIISLKNYFSTRRNEAFTSYPFVSDLHPASSPRL